MFLLSETELIGSIPLKTISRIDISFYKSRNESLNIFNLELDFDENLIPLITSTLECKPILISRKTYFGLDTDYIIENPIDCNGNIGYMLGEYTDDNGRYPSFHFDLDTFNKNKTSSNKKSYWQTRTLHYSNLYVKSQELVRIYARGDLNNDRDNNRDNDRDSRSNSKIFNPQDAIGCKSEIVIYWPVYGMSKFELCILPKENNKKCIWHFVVDVIEDNHFIDSKVDAVNTWLEKIHKIKSTIKIANQNTNTKEI